ncbi:Ovarian tumor [Macleaya cordata]|uniref:Ovarian tumor n=1 Tax=Macleaya cordata TaxID=56857 RepID=A0A200R429_MACCD|nr:Ovarian tumor [Macleaya cordata]
MHRFKPVRASYVGRDKTYQPSPPALPWRDPTSASFESLGAADPDLEEKTTWETVSGLEDQQKRYLERLYAKGVLWKHPENDSSPTRSTIFRLSHGGDVEADGNCLFTASQKAMGADIDARELRRRTVKRFTEDLGSEDGGLERESIDAAIKHLYSPDLKAGWGIHVVQEVKLLAKKEDREGLDVAIKELVDLGLQREVAAESIYKERCIAVEDGPSWAQYMSISGSPQDEYDIITLQYTEEGLLSVDENREGHAAAFGDDIAIESLATEFKREIYVVQAHGSDAMVDEDNCVFFLPHRPRSQICGPPFFLFMKGTGWCGAGADHYEPLIAHSAPLISQEKAAVVL